VSSGAHLWPVLVVLLPRFLLLAPPHRASVDLRARARMVRVSAPRLLWPASQEGWERDFRYGRHGDDQGEVPRRGGQAFEQGGGRRTGSSASAGETLLEPSGGRRSSGDRGLLEQVKRGEGRSRAARGLAVRFSATLFAGVFRRGGPRGCGRQRKRPSRWPDGLPRAGEWARRWGRL